MLDERGCVQANILAGKLLKCGLIRLAFLNLLCLTAFRSCTCAVAVLHMDLAGCMNESVMLVGVGERSSYELTSKSEVNYTVNIDLSCGRHGDLKWFGLCFIILESFHTVLKLKHAAQPP